jgi:hypothetical protein
MLPLVVFAIGDRSLCLRNTCGASLQGCTARHARLDPIIQFCLSALHYCRFALYNVVGALVWTVLFLGAGFFFGNLPVVQHNFTLVVLGIVAVSVLPVVLEVMAARREHGQSGGGPAGNGAAA